MPPAGPRILGRLGLMAGSAVLALALGELLLAAAGAPGDGCDVVGHPPGLRLTREAHEFRFRFATDGRGLRCREDGGGPPPGLPRVLALGDSFTEGFGVEYDDAWPARLEAELARRGHPAAVVNGGLAGASLVDMLRIGLASGLGTRPDLVLLAFHANDVRETSPEALLAVEADPAGGLVWNRGRGQLRDLASRLLPRIYTLFKRARAKAAARERAAEREPGRDGLVAKLVAEATRRGLGEAAIAAWKARLGPERLGLLDVGMLEPSMLGKGLLEPDWWTRCLDLEGPDLPARWQAAERALAVLTGLARPLGFKLMATYLPAPVQYDPATRALHASWGMACREEWQAGPAAIEVRLEAWARSAGVPWLDLASGFRSLPPDRAAASRYLLDGHWGPEGHRLAAAAMAPWVDAGLARP